MMDEMDRALELDGEKLEQLTGCNHGPMTMKDVIPSYYWEDSPFPDGDEAALQEAFDRANGGPVYVGFDPSSDYVDRLALSRVRAMVATDIHNLGAVAAHTSLRQSASETPIEFLRRLITAYLSEAMS